jgi:hypothetical protein
MQLERAGHGKSSVTEQTAADVIAFIRASCFAQRVTSGAQAVQLLAKSRRIRDDVSRVCLMQGERVHGVEGSDTDAHAAEVSTSPPSSSGAQSFTLSVIIRPWLEAIAPEYEFRYNSISNVRIPHPEVCPRIRAFVSQRRVVAITQYYKLAYVIFIITATTGAMSKSSGPRTGERQAARAGSCMQVCARRCGIFVRIALLRIRRWRFDAFCRVDAASG